MANFLAVTQGSIPQRSCYAEETEPQEIGLVMDSLEHGPKEEKAGQCWILIGGFLQELGYELEHMDSW